MDKFSKAFEIVDRMVKMGENLPNEDKKDGMRIMGVVALGVMAIGGILAVMQKGMDVIGQMGS